MECKLLVETSLLHKFDSLQSCRLSLRTAEPTVEQCCMGSKLEAGSQNLEHFLVLPDASRCLETILLIGHFRHLDSNSLRQFVNVRPSAFQLMIDGPHTSLSLTDLLIFLLEAFLPVLLMQFRYSHSFLPDHTTTISELERRPPTQFVTRLATRPTGILRRQQHFQGRADKLTQQQLVY